MKKNVRSCVEFHQSINSFQIFTLWRQSIGVDSVCCAFASAERDSESALLQRRSHLHIVSASRCMFVCVRRVEKKLNVYQYFRLANFKCSAKVHFYLVRSQRRPWPPLSVGSANE